MEIIIILLNQSIGGNNARTCWEEILAINKTHNAIIQCSLLTARPCGASSPVVGGQEQVKAERFRSRWLCGSS